MTRSTRGVTLIEVLITTIISSIAMMGLALPFMAERYNWLLGEAQAESQRDAQMALRAIARVARHGSSYEIRNLGPTGKVKIISLNPPDFTSLRPFCFEGGLNEGGEFGLKPSCDGLASGPFVTTYIDGIRSKVTNFTLTPITSRQLRVHLEVTHTPIVGGPRQETEVLETDLFLRNAS